MIKNLGIYFNKIVEKNKNNVAVKIDEDNQYSYQEFNIISEKFVIYLKSLKLKSRDHILIESKKNVYSYAILIACLKLGISYSFIDVTQAPKRIEKIIKRVNAKKVILYNEAIKIKNSLHLSDKRIEKILVNKIKINHKIKNVSNIAYIMFTSGSTGEPKGVKISHSNLFYLIKWSKKFFKINNKSVFSNLNPLHFDNSVFDIYCSLFNSASIIPVQKNEFFYFNKLIRRLNKLDCNIWFSVPSLLNLILNLNSPKVFKKLKLKKFIFGGEPFPLISARKIFKHNSNINFYNVSGPTECTCICSAHKINKRELMQEQNQYIGKINNYFKYKIIPSNKNGKIGELFLEGPAVAEGYVNDKKKTREKFYKTKKFFGYKTGDIVQKFNKNLFKIIGRKDNQIKISGHRIEIEEIENTINKVFNLDQSLILLKKKITFPYKKLLLITNSKKITNNIINEKLPKYLPNYMIPEDVKFTKKFRFNSNGKIDRKFYGQKTY